MAKKNQLPVRTTTDVRNEYMQVCAQAGEAQYKVAEFQKALAEINKKLVELNQEFAELLKKEQKKAAAKPPVLPEASNGEE